MRTEVFARQGSQGQPGPSPAAGMLCVRPGPPGLPAPRTAPARSRVRAEPRACAACFTAEQMGAVDVL